MEEKQPDAPDARPPLANDNEDEGRVALPVIPDGADPATDGADPATDGADPSADGADPSAGRVDPAADDADLLSDELAPIPQLRQEICRLFPQIARIELIRLHATESTLLAAALLQDGMIDREALGKRMVSHCAARGITLFPALYSPREWAQLDRAMPEMRWLDSFQQRRGQIALVELYREHRQHPGDMRRLLIQTIKHHLAFFDFIQRSLLFPSHLSLAFAEVIIRESLELLYATEGLEFSADVDTIDVFEEHFVDKGPFSIDHILLYFQLAGLVRQSKHYYQLTLDEEPAFDWLLIAKQACQFLEVFRRHALQTWSTAEERKRMQVRRLVTTGASAFVVVVAVIWYLVATRPLSPIEDLSVITKPGGIVGRYFKDIKLKEQVLERTDTTLSLSTYGHVDREKKVPKDHFGARWKGFIRFTKKGKYVLCSEDDDGVRIYLNNELFIDDWKAARRKTCKPVRVKAGWYPLRVDYYDLTYGAVMRLLRGEHEDRTRIVPAQDLCCQK